MESSPSESSRLKVESLKGTNYHPWSNKMEVVLRGKDIWKYGDPRIDTKATEYTSGHKSDIALAYLLMSIDKSCKLSVIRMRDTCEIWRHL